MATTINNILRDATTDYLATQVRSNPPLPRDIEEELLKNIKHDIQSENAIRVQAKEPKLSVPNTLAPVQIAEIIAYFHPVYCIMTGGEGADRSNDLLGLYQSQGPNQGIYVIDDETIRSLIRQYNYTINSKEIVITVFLIMIRKNLCRLIPSIFSCRNQE